MMARPILWSNMLTVFAVCGQVLSWLETASPLRSVSSLLNCLINGIYFVIIGSLLLFPVFRAIYSELTLYNPSNRNIMSSSGPDFSFQGLCFSLELTCSFLYFLFFYKYQFSSLVKIFYKQECR